MNALKYTEISNHRFTLSLGFNKFKLVYEYVLDIFGNSNQSLIECLKIFILGFTGRALRTSYLVTILAFSCYFSNLHFFNVLQETKVFADFSV